MRCVEAKTLDSKGYGKSNGRNTYRNVYIEAQGEPPERFHIHHLCGNPACELIDHLIAVSITDHHKLHRKESDLGPMCSRGHADEWSVNNRGHRICKACGREDHKAYRERNQHE